MLDGHVFYVDAPAWDSSLYWGLEVIFN